MDKPSSYRRDCSELRTPKSLRIRTLIRELELPTRTLRILIFTLSHWTMTSRACVIPMRPWLRETTIWDKSLNPWTVTSAFSQSRTTSFSASSMDSLRPMRSLRETSTARTRFNRLDSKSTMLSSARWLKSARADLRSVVARGPCNPLKGAIRDKTLFPSSNNSSLVATTSGTKLVLRWQAEPETFHL